MNDTKKHRGIVFKISHPDIDDNCYIGQTLQSLSARWATLKTNAKKWKKNPEKSFKLSRLYKAIIDHGPDQMKIVELEGHEHSSKDELVKILKEREAHFINVNNSLKKGWNNLSKKETEKKRKYIVNRVELIIKIIAFIFCGIMLMAVLANAVLEMAGPITAALVVILVPIIFALIIFLLSKITKSGGGSGSAFSGCGGCGGGGGGGCGGGD